MATKTKQSRQSASLERRVRRFTGKQTELALKLSNDIAEGIDCGETREQLRMAILFWSDTASVQAQERAAAESKIAIFQSAKKLMDVVIPPNDKLSDRRE